MSYVQTIAGTLNVENPEDLVLVTSGTYRGFEPLIKPFGFGVSVFSVKKGFGWIWLGDIKL